jgi:hypothetical protein
MIFHLLQLQAKRLLQIRAIISLETYVPEMQSRYYSSEPCLSYMSLLPIGIISTGIAESDQPRIQSI